ncbi:uncharacterized protein METZ01_LOCUS456729, partial [marine metagenome]
MSIFIWRLGSALGKIDKLVTKIDEGNCIAAAVDFEIKKAAVESEGFINVAYFQCDMIDSDRLCLGIFFIINRRHMTTHQTIYAYR